jgi:hypothetical protein
LFCENYKIPRYAQVDKDLTCVTGGGLLVGGENANQKDKMLIVISNGVRNLIYLLFAG